MLLEEHIKIDYRPGCRAAHWKKKPVRKTKNLLLRFSKRSSFSEVNWKIEFNQVSCDLCDKFWRENKLVKILYTSNVNYEENLSFVIIDF